MPRPYHSPSSVELGRRCKRAWAYRYIAGLKKPEVEWREDLKGRDRSLALGKALHATLEAHYKGEQPNWHWFPGQVAASGLDYLPPHKASVYVEAAIGDLTLDLGGTFDAGEDRGTGLVIHGVRWLGYIDLVERASGRVIDYKTTASIEKYAKSVAVLQQDLQANLYAYAFARAFDADSVDCRWVYFETGKVRRSEPRDFVITRCEALSVLEPAAELARELDQIESVEAASMNPSACADYGGCEFHVKVGGPCNARASLGSLVQARVSKQGKEIMPLPASTQASLAARLASRAAPAAAPPPGPVGPEPEDNPPMAPPVDPPPGAHVTTTETPPAPKPAARGKKSAVAGSGTLAQIAAELTAAEAAHADAAAALENAKDAMRKALT